MHITWKPIVSTDCLGPLSQSLWVQFWTPDWGTSILMGSNGGDQRCRGASTAHHLPQVLALGKRCSGGSWYIEVQVKEIATSVGGGPWWHSLRYYLCYPDPPSQALNLEKPGMSGWLHSLLSSPPLICLNPMDSVPLSSLPYCIALFSLIDQSLFSKDAPILWQSSLCEEKLSGYFSRQHVPLSPVLLCDSRGLS